MQLMCALQGTLIPPNSAAACLPVCAPPSVVNSGAAKGLAGAALHTPRTQRRPPNGERRPPSSAARTATVQMPVHMQPAAACEGMNVMSAKQAPHTRKTGAWQSWRVVNDWLIAGAGGALPPPAPTRAVEFRGCS